MMLEARQLSKSFAAVNAVDGVSFTAHDGRVTGLLGANGAGKSTTLRMLYGAVTPDSGTALIDGIDIKSSKSEALNRLGVLPHNSGIYPNLTARENIAYFGELFGLKGSELKCRVEELLERFKLSAVARRRAKGFSQGEKLKVALARAMVHNPKTLILDEPTNGLDVLGIRALREEILGLRDAGHCILFSSHVMQEVVALCDDLVLIGAGRVIACGSPDQLREEFKASSLEDAFIKALERSRC